MLKIITGLISLLFMTSMNFHHTSYCFPENNLSFPVDAKSTSGLSEKEFNTVLDEFEAVMNLEVSRVENGARLTLNRYWDDANVNAVAYQGGIYRYVSMYGGLARHPEATTDLFRLVACHELGHHLGGAPKKSGGGIFGGGAAWASNEGQSDYYATLKCFRRLIIEARDMNLAVAPPDFSKYPKSEIDFATATCAKSFSTDLDMEICLRGAMGGYSVGRLFASFAGSADKISLTSPAQSIVSRTNHNHPFDQCRADTYFQGSVCDKSYKDDVSPSNEDKSTCTAKNKDSLGLRPRCWFKPSV